MFIVNQCLGPSFDGFDYLPAEETRGGILLAWKSSEISILTLSHDSYSVTGEVRSSSSEPWWIMVIYGPQRAEDKTAFLTELEERRSLCPGAWLVIGDFNMILHAAEKNNENLSTTMMARFRDFVNEQELRELYLHGRLYTWSNERRVPTMTRIDKALVTIDWELAFPNALLQALSSSVSDHTPLHLSMDACYRPKKRFKFETFWLRLEGFEEAVTEGWRCHNSIVDPFIRLDTCFRNLATFL
jgi:hypothetical protein